MSLLTPDFTGPVRLNMSVSDAKREALGRTLGAIGAAVGIVGAVTYLSGSPALKAALRSEQPVSLTLSPEEAKRDALGKSLALIGTGVGLAGTVLALSGNPALRDKVPGMRAVAAPAGQAILLTVVAGWLVWSIQRQKQALLTSRYAS